MSSDYQILLLPKSDYWTWVEAAKDYAGRFGISTTSDPDAAARYMAPQQTITVAGLPNGYPAQGDIRAWFRKQYAELRLDYLPCQSPADFESALQARLKANQRFWLSAASFKLRWPTDFAIVAQAFGENPELYRRWSLPGHEGLDIFAPDRAKIYACASGTVSRVDVFNGNAEKMPYGNSVRVQHADGYLTVYAHLSDTLVRVGDVVEAGQLIGRADASGNSAGGHLHLTLKKTGATAGGQTQFPRDIIDPTPYLIWPDAVADPAAPAVQYPWQPGMCLVGLHGRADGRFEEADFGPFQQARVEAVKLLSMARPQDMDRLLGINPRMFVLMRLFASFDGRDVSPADFMSWVVPDVQPFYQRGVRYFEVHNEPNLRPEGWTTSWNDGHEFGDWFIDFRIRFKQQFPLAQVGYPGLSPGDGIDGLRMRATDFLTGSDAACRAADWVGLHCYWVSEQEFNSANGGLGYLEYRRRFPGKVLFITEFSNVNLNTDKRTKGQQYVRYYQHLRSLPGIGCAFAFIVSASAGFLGETWRAEDGTVSEVPGLVAGRTDTGTATPPV